MAGSHGPSIGVLALQGDVHEHIGALAKLGIVGQRVRRTSELDDVNGLIIPGGESTVIDKLSRTFGLAQPIVERLSTGMPVYGTCAGMIMLADRIADGINDQQTFGGLDITVRRNAFGTQSDSFEQFVPISALGRKPVRAAFIRAPIVESAGQDVITLGALADGTIVAVQQGNLLATAFHPEVTGELRLHAHFAELVD